MVRKQMSGLFCQQWQRIRESTCEGFAFVLTTVRGLYFPDEITLYTDSFIRIVFSLYYIPSIMVVVALTHSALQRVVWVLVVPVTQEMERNPYSFSSWETLVMGLWHIGLQIAPFAALGISFATIGHKTMNCFTEAMIDAYTRQDNKDYPLMRARFQYLTEKSNRLSIFTAVSAVLMGAIVTVLYKRSAFSVPADEAAVLIATIAISSAQALFVVLTVFRGAPTDVLENMTRSLSDSGSFSWIASARRGSRSNSQSTTPLTGPPAKEDDWAVPRAFLAYFESDWWGHHIQYMRHIAFAMVGVTAIIFSLFRGPLTGVMVAVQTVMCLNFPHLFGYTSLSITTAIIRTVRSFQWVGRHPDALLPCVVVALPYQTVLVSALFWFRHHPLTTLLIMGINVLLAARSIDLVREFDMTAHGSVCWEDASSGKYLMPHLAIMLEDAYEKKHVRSAIVSLDMSIDVKHMHIQYANGECRPLTRQQIIPYGAARRFLRSKHFYTYTIPRLLSLQSPGYFVGSRFRTARVLLRVLSITMLLLFGTIVSGMILQAAFPQLRPIPVRVSASEDMSMLTFDHIVLRMHMLSRDADPALVTVNKRSSYTTSSSASAFEWNEVNDTTGRSDIYTHLCQRDYEGTSVWELALLSLAPYLFNDDEVKTMLEFMNIHMDTDWVIRPRHGSSCVTVDSNHKPTGYVGFYDFFSQRRNTSVIAIRGTDMFSFTDFLIDINLFFETVLYQFMTMVIPGAVVVPKNLVANLIRTASLPPDEDDDDDRHTLVWKDLLLANRGGSGKGGPHHLRTCHQNNFMRDFFADVHNHIGYVGTQPNPPRHLILTGHSLGGAVAAIVAAKLDVKAVAFSAPGILLARRKFNLDVLNIHRNVMTVMSSNDIVPAIGEHGGEIHHVECLATTVELCHAMEFLIGSLWRSCHSIRSRFPSIKDVV